jgi:LTXXQ motif family protein
MELTGVIARYVRTNGLWNLAMRGRTILLITVLGAAIPLPDAGQAQLSPQGVIGGISRPFRQMLGHFGHFPRARHYRASAAEARAAAAAPSNETSNVAGSRLGRVGPPVWPDAYEDLLGFTFWPEDYASRLRGRGFDVIADTIIGRFDLPRPSARAATTGAAVKNDSNNESSVDQCGDFPNTGSNWPAARVEQILQLSDAQHESLEKMQMAVAQSIKNIRADCRGSGTLAPPDRLSALVQTLWTVRDAGISMRGPLKNFHDTLTNTQKDSFAGHQPQNGSPPDPKTASNGMNKQFQACASQNAEKAERMIKEIEMKIRPNKDQAPSLEDLHKTSADMAKLLIASCAQPIPADPMARLDAADDQLTAINYAATTVQIAFGNFYLKLNNDQRARFDSLAR